MAYDAWALYGNTGIVELDPGRHDFTISFDNYVNPILDANSCLKEFIIDQSQTIDGIFLINEQGLKICPEGLNIINYSNAWDIVFHSVGDDWINILGSININDNPARLIFISDYKINCNGCNFLGIEVVRFCTMPNDIIKSKSLNLASFISSVDISISWKLLQ